MTDRPIIFSAPMIRALLAGTKTQTRRLATSPLRRCEVGDRLWVKETHYRTDDGDYERAVPAADVDAVRDHLATIDRLQASFPDASVLESHRKLRPSIHMPRWASRLTLIVEGVRVEPLQAISEADAVAEGCKAQPFPGPWWQGYRDIGTGELLHQEAIGDTPPDWMIEPKPMRPTPWLDRSSIDGYRLLWSSLHTVAGQRWENNPDVVALTFRVERGNIDQVPS